MGRSIAYFRPLHLSRLAQFAHLCVQHYCSMKAKLLPLWLIFIIAYNYTKLVQVIHFSIMYTTYVSNVNNWKALCTLTSLSAVQPIVIFNIWPKLHTPGPTLIIPGRWIRLTYQLSQKFMRRLTFPMRSLSSWCPWCLTWNTATGSGRGLWHIRTGTPHQQETLVLKWYFHRYWWWWNIHCINCVCVFVCKHKDAHLLVNKDW